MASLQFTVSVACLLAGAAFSAEVTPIEKVISLLEGMKKEAEDAGKAEAKTYGDFACFCQKTTGTKSTSIKDGNDKIDSLSANIADKTASKEGDEAEVAKRKDKQEKLAKDLADTNTRCAKEKAEYEAEAADLSKAISSLKDAITSMMDSKPSSGELSGRKTLSLRLLSVREGLHQTLQMAEAMNMIATPKHKAIASLIQGKAGVDPEDPEYEFHSNEIVQILKDLHKDYTDQKRNLDSEYAKAKKGCDEMKASLKKQMAANKDAIVALGKSIEKLGKEIAKHREDLVESESSLKDDELYLKDLTAQCEARANDFDQRSAMRADEITALSTALKILKNEVTPADKVNVRAMLLQKMHKADTPAPQQLLPAKVTEPSVSFLQEVSTHGQSKALLGESSFEERKSRAIKMLGSEGQRLRSIALTSLAAGSAADPFKKVKGLIEKLIQRLVEESRAEATKKGFCDTELAKSEKDRDFRFQEANDLSADIAGLEAKRDELTEEITLLTSELKSEKLTLKETTAERKEEKETNMKTLKTAKEGLDAVNEALIVIKAFYAQAAKAAFLQASPLDEDTTGAGFSSSYKGQQSSSNAVLDLLETISSDFDRTIRTTDAAENKAHLDYVEFSQAAKSSIASKTTKKELDEQDLKTTKTNIKAKTADLQTAFDLLDSALQVLEELKPTCMDSGMSYSERVQKREEEMAALTKALCILDEGDAEPECSGSGRAILK